MIATKRRAPSTAPIRIARTDDALRLHLPEPPSSNRWWRAVTIKGQARMLLSSDARDYKAMVLDALTAHGITPLPEDVDLSVTIAWYRSRRSGDLDKRIGVALDALQGTVYVSDAQITHLEATRHDGGAGVLVVDVRVISATQLSVV